MSIITKYNEVIYLETAFALLQDADRVPLDAIMETATITLLRRLRRRDNDRNRTEARTLIRAAHANFTGKGTKALRAVGREEAALSTRNALVSVTDGTYRVVTRVRDMTREDIHAKFEEMERGAHNAEVAADEVGRVLTL